MFSPETNETNTHNTIFIYGDWKLKKSVNTILLKLDTSVKRLKPHLLTPLSRNNQLRVVKGNKTKRPTDAASEL